MVPVSCTLVLLMCNLKSTITIESTTYHIYTSLDFTFRFILIRSLSTTFHAIPFHPHHCWRLMRVVDPFQNWTVIDDHPLDSA